MSLQEEIMETACALAKSFEGMHTSHVSAIIVNAIKLILDAAPDNASRAQPLAQFVGGVGSLVNFYGFTEDQMMAEISNAIKNKATIQ